LPCSPARLVPLLAAVLLALPPAAPAQTPPDDEPPPELPVVDPRVERVLRTLDGDDATVDGQGEGGWTVDDLPQELQRNFRQLTDRERATYYISDLEGARLAFTEEVVEPELRRFDVFGKWIHSGHQVIAIELWGSVEVEDRLKVYLILRYPGSDDHRPIRRWRTYVRPDGSFRIRQSMRGQQLLYGDYFLTAICDPSTLWDPSAYAVGTVIGRLGGEHTLYWLGHESETLRFGTDEDIDVQEVVLKRFYTRMLDDILLPLYAEYHDRWMAIDAGEQDITEVVTSGEGPVPEVTRLVFDDTRWRQFLDLDFRPMLRACDEALVRHRRTYVAPRFPQLLDGLRVAIRNLDALSRHRSRALYRKYQLGPTGADAVPFDQGFRTWTAWQRRFDASVVALRRMGARMRTVQILQRRVEDHGWTVPAQGLPLPDREEVRRQAEAWYRSQEAAGPPEVPPPAPPAETEPPGAPPEEQ
jgi:hypothetical protein